MKWEKERTSQSRQTAPRNRVTRTLKNWVIYRSVTLSGYVYQSPSPLVNRLKVGRSPSSRWMPLSDWYIYCPYMVSPSAHSLTCICSCFNEWSSWIISGENFTRPYSGTSSARVLEMRQHSGVEHKKICSKTNIYSRYNLNKVYTIDRGTRNKTCHWCFYFYPCEDIKINKPKINLRMAAQYPIVICLYIER